MPGEYIESKRCIWLQVAGQTCRTASPQLDELAGSMDFA